MARGVTMGRKPKLTPHEVKEIIRRKENGEAVRETARSYNIHNSTISRLTAQSNYDAGASFAIKSVMQSTKRFASAMACAALAGDTVEPEPVS